MSRGLRVITALSIALSPALWPSSAEGQATARPAGETGVPWAEEVDSVEERPSLAVLDVRADFELANAVYEEDRLLAAGADALLREELAKHGRFTLLDPGRVSGAVPEGLDGTCSGSACAVAVGKATGADYVLAATLRKISNLVWLVTGEVVEAATGRVMAAETLEMKGVPGEMVPTGIAVLARRLSLGR